MHLVAVVLPAAAARTIEQVVIATVPLVEPDQNFGLYLFLLRRHDQLTHLCREGLFYWVALMGQLSVKTDVGLGSVPDFRDVKIIKVCFVETLRIRKQTFAAFNRFVLWFYGVLFRPEVRVNVGCVLAAVERSLEICD